MAGVADGGSVGVGIGRSDNKETNLFKNLPRSSLCSWKKN
jgi:hypothetical protein